MHESYIEDERGDVIDAIPYCSDACHREYVGDAYAGWNGALETEFTTYCANCGVAIPGEDACEHQLANVVVNRFTSEDGEKCEHGNWIQLPAARVMRNIETAARLEYLRTQIRAEQISYGELAELQGLADQIEPGDVELAEWVGIPEEEFAKR